MIIDETYFKGEINIAQLSQETVLSNLQTFIDKYEPRCLKLLLGLGFYRDFMAVIDPISGAEQRWVDLLNGKIYTSNGREFEWIGFQNLEKQSLIANYIYWFYITKEVQHTTGMGQVKPTTENGQPASAMPKLVRAWNEMVEWNRSCIHFLDSNRIVYPEWNPYCENRWFYEYDFPFGYGLYYEDVNWPSILRPQNTLGI